MKSGMNSKAAQGKLDKQIEQLGELRNGGTRAVEFREWRQTTLTLIERIWPDQSSRATRFRRIPFSPASAKSCSIDLLRSTSTSNHSGAGSTAH